MAKLKTKETEILKLTSISVLKVNANAGLANADSFEQKKRMINRSNGRRKIAIEDSQPVSFSYFADFGSNQDTNRSIS